MGNSIFLERAIDQVYEKYDDVSLYYSPQDCLELILNCRLPVNVSVNKNYTISPIHNSYHFRMSAKLNNLIAPENQLWFSNIEPIIEIRLFKDQGSSYVPIPNFIFRSDKNKKALDIFGIGLEYNSCKSFDILCVCHNSFNDIRFKFSDLEYDFQIPLGMRFVFDKRDEEPWELTGF